MPELTAAIIAGPRWWGEAQTGRDGKPVAKSEFKARKEQAHREVEIMREVVAELPEDCFVIQGGARGADLLAASLCKARGIETAGVPYFGSKGKQGGYLRNLMMATLLNGLALQGYKVKVVVMAPEDGITTGTKMMKDIAEDPKFGIFVKVVRYAEPTPEEPVEAGEENA